MPRERMKMAAYVIGDIDVTDPAAFQEYRDRFGATVEQYGRQIRGSRRQGEPQGGRLAASPPAHARVS
jgi:uncharacterized protein (DUF1330 family)